MNYFIIYFILDTLWREEAVLPVTITSISIKPVNGSVAACCVATFIKLMASSTSYSVTFLDNFILAKA